MKEIIAILIFLICGIYSETKLNLLETILLIFILFITDFFILIINKFDRDKKVRFKNFKILLLNFKDFINYKKIILCLIFFAYGFISSYISNHHFNPYSTQTLYDKREYEGVITKITTREENYKAKVKLKSVNENVEVYIDKSLCNEIYAGYKIKLKGMLTNINSVKNLGSYNEKEYKRAQRIYYNFSGEVLNVSPGYIFIVTDLSKLRNKICNIYDSLLSEKYSSIIKAMITGESSLLDSDTKTLYKNGGVFHILAISGMHIGIISLFLKKILSYFIKNKKIKFTCLVSILFLYTIFTGMNISTIRALLMTIFSEISLLLDREYDSLSGLSLACLIILMINSANLFNVSFILSFSAILSMKAKLRLKGIFKNYASTISVFMLMTPILTYNFYNFQGLSMIANIFILPLTSTLVISSFILIFLKYINFNLAIILGKLISLILMYYEEVLTYLSKLNGFKIISGKLSLFTIIVWYVSYFILYKIIKEKRDTIRDKRRFLLYIKLYALSLIIFLFSIFYKPNEIDVTFIDVDHGDSILIFDKKENKSLLIDGGGKNDNEKDTGNYNVFPYLNYLGLSKLDVCVVTHTDRDHIKGIIELISLIDIGEILVPQGTLSGNYYEELKEKAVKYKIPIIAIDNNSYFELGRVHIDCIYPPPNIDDYKFKPNNYSVVLNMKIDDKDFLFTGDIEKEAEEIIIDSNKIERNVFLMKVAHHGSNTSSTDEFVKVVSPKYLIVSGNKANITNFNKKNVYKFKNSKIITTYYSGMINFKIRGVKC
ncbi:MAG: DNA internalization-related competence protein ComEC/Rec2 [Clostridia bacterium]|nr:DNA internalization-related competence protein ComEC/Rec2 [Clostridia bacterium]